MLSLNTTRALAAHRANIHLVKFAGNETTGMQPCIEGYATKEEAIKRAVYLDGLNPDSPCHLETSPASFLLIDHLCEQMATRSAKRGIAEMAKNLLAFSLTLK